MTVTATPQRLWPAVLGGWALASLILCVALSHSIAGLRFPDPDDAMRLLEVRDWLGGQSWWDVGQHRLNGGHFPMHWSRLVDLPLAGVMVVFDPFLSQGIVDRIAMTIVPLATLLALMTCVAVLTRRLAGLECAQLAVLLVALSLPIVNQMRPMRIDHHGWQIVLAAAAMLAMTGKPTARSGALCGLALATLVTVSLEGLPVTVVFVAIAALAWAIDPARRTFLTALAATLFFVAAIFQIATRGPAMFAPACDAISPAWLAVLGVAAIALTIATYKAGHSLTTRLLTLAIGAGACLATLVVTAPDCMRGPFATLDPLVYTLWYRNVAEGLPIWSQIPAWGVMTIAFPIVGLIGTGLALRAAHGANRADWWMVLAVLSGAFVVTILVTRAGGTANALALPGGAWLLLTLLKKARSVRRPVPRLFATAGAVLAVAPGVVAAAVFRLSHVETPPVVTDGHLYHRPSCTDFADVRATAMLPPGTIFAPLDITVDMIAMTPHHGIGAGYHRNADAIHRVLATFTGSSEAAEPMIRATGARYIVGCPGLNETEIYKDLAPNGFWAQLERGRHFAWLTPIALPGSPLLTWKVNDSSRAPLSRTPTRP